MVIAPLRDIAHRFKFGETMPLVSGHGPQRLRRVIFYGLNELT